MRRSGERRKAIKCKDKEHARYRNAVRVFCVTLGSGLEQQPVSQQACRTASTKAANLYEKT